jgi:uncharacterized protein (DUF58 family)
MIVPRERLLLWTALAVVPALAVAGAAPAAAGPLLSLAALLAAAAAVDALRARRPLAGLSARWRPPQRLARGRAGEIQFLLAGTAGAPSPLRLALEAPAALGAEETRHVALPADAAAVRLGWPCRALERGRLPVPALHVEAASPWGCWDARRRLPLDGEVRVYPDVLAERRRLAALFLPRGAPGRHARRQPGQGREFEQLRDYVPGDPLDAIHWKATARRGRAVTKVHQLERTQEVHVLVDASRLSARRAAPDGVPALERSLTAALLLGLAARRQGDLFGVLAFSDRVRAFVRARGGAAHFTACREALFALAPEPVSPDFEELFAFVRTRLRRRSLLVVLTALDDPELAESFQRGAALVARQHLLLAVMPRPAGAHALFEGPPPATLEAAWAGLAGHSRWMALRTLRRALRRLGVTLALPGHEALAAETVAQYLAVKRRQLL